MSAKRALPLVMPITLITLCNATMAVAQEAGASATNYQELVWLFLALLLGFSIVARRASRLDQNASETSRNTTQAKATAPYAASSIRLVDKPAKENAVHVNTRANIELGSPKKTA